MSEGSCGGGSCTAGAFAALAAACGVLKPPGTVVGAGSSNEVGGDQKGIGDATEEARFCICQLQFLISDQRAAEGDSSMSSGFSHQWQQSNGTRHCLYTATTMQRSKCSADNLVEALAWPEHARPYDILSYHLKQWCICAAQSSFRLEHFGQASIDPAFLRVDRLLWRCWSLHGSFSCGSSCLPVAVQWSGSSPSGFDCACKA